MPQPASERAPRGFDWQLAALQRKRGWDLEAARLEVASALSTWQSAQAAQQAAQAAVDQASQQCRNALATGPDPQLHPGLLHHLVQLGHALARRTACQTDAAHSLQAARQRLMRRQQDVDVIAQAHAKALAAHRRKQMWRDQSEADAGWLALQRLRGPAADALAQES